MYMYIYIYIFIYLFIYYYYYYHYYLYYYCYYYSGADATWTAPELGFPNVCVFSDVHLFVFYMFSEAGVPNVRLFTCFLFVVHVSSNENPKPKHAIGKCFLRVAISIGTPSFPTAQGLFVPFCARSAQVGKFWGSLNRGFGSRGFRTT